MRSSRGRIERHRQCGEGSRAMNVVKTEDSSAVNPILRFVRSKPTLYSATCKGRLVYSRRIAGRRDRALLDQHRSLFFMSEEERRHSDELRTKGFTVLPDVFEV